jgi:hypothetical protein
MRNLWDAMSQTDKHTLDVVGMMALVGTWAEILPNAVLFLTGAYTLIRIIETESIQRLFRRKKNDGEDS